MTGPGLVDPGNGHPLARRAHEVDGLLEVSDGLVDLVVDDGLVKVVCVGLLQDLRLLLQPLERLVLLGGDGERWTGGSGLSQ